MPTDDNLLVFITDGKLQWTLLAVVASSAILGLWGARFYYSKKNAVTGKAKTAAPLLAGHLPFIRHLHIIIKNVPRAHDFWLEETVLFDWKPWQIALPGRSNLLIISDPVSLEHVLKTKFHRYDKGQILGDVLKDFLGEGIFLVDGEAWKLKRRMIGKFVTEGAVHGFIADVMIEHVTKLRQSLIEQLMDADANGGGGGARGGGGQPYVKLDMQEMFFMFTMEVFLRHAFGVECPNAKEFSKNFDRVNVLSNGRFNVPPLIWKLMRLVKIGPERELRSGIKAIHSLASEIIKSAERKEVKQSDTNAESCVSSGTTTGAADQIKSGTSGTKYAYGRQISLMDIIVEAHGSAQATASAQRAMRFDVLNLLLAGRDTTAVSLTWFYIEMMRRPDILAKVRQEVDALLEPLQYVLSVAQCSQVPYLRAVLLETMRLHTPVPSTARCCSEADVLPCGVEVPVGTCLVHNPYSMCRNPAIWGLDAEFFFPKRWLDPSRSYSDYEYPVFNAGPRICIGKKLAMMEMTMVAACLVSTFDVEYNGGPDRPLESLTYDTGILLQVKGPVDVKVSRRDRSRV